MKAAVTLAVASVLALTGCGAQQQQSSVDTFQGAEREVAQKVEDLQDAGSSREPENICSDILAASLVDDLKAAGTDCQAEMRKAIEDADDFELEVIDVTINGNSATARVRQGDDGPTETMQFTREGGQWRATSLSGS
jgi:hypothetical protein